MRYFEFLMALVVFFQMQRLIWILAAWVKTGNRKPTDLRLEVWDGMQFQEASQMNLKVSQQLPISITAADEFGNPTGAFDAAPVWSVVDGTLGSVVASADGLSAVFTPSGKLGVTQVQVAGLSDAKSLAGSLDLALIAGDATEIVLSAGTPVDFTPVPVVTPAPAA